MLLGDSVRVVYDDRAVPHIFANSEEDAYRALGYVVARDRLFQMYLQTLAASGRLTEIAGARTLALDRETRGLGLPRAAERIVASIADTSQVMRYARAYAAGVNAYIRQMPASELPLEFRLTGTKPFEWKPVDSYHLASRMGYTLAYIAAENDRSAAASRIGTAAAEALFPENTPIQEPIQPNGQNAPRLDFHPLPPPGSPDSSASMLVAATNAFLPSRRVATADPEDDPKTFASNNWAVSPRRTANSHALLAGDPHLDLSLPSIWYEVHIVVPGTLDVYGVTIPGAPHVVIGFNRDVAWTFTNTGADVLDYFAEHVDNDESPAKYMVDSAWRPLEKRIERYHGQRNQVIATDTLYFTHRGPMRRVGARWVSMRWTVLESGREVEAFYGIAHAKSASELEDIMGRLYQAPAQNMLAADRGGHIAIRSTGRYPLRAGNGKGDVVRDGSLSANDWRGALPLTQYPQSADPAQGYLASANQQPIDPRAAVGWWGGSYDPWRALRINALLRADSAMTPDKMRLFQTDPGSARADLFVPSFLQAAQRAHNGMNMTQVSEARRLLAEWDRRYTKDNRRAVLFEEAMRELVTRTWDELSVDQGAGRRVATPSTAVLAELLADSSSAWWDDRSTPEVEHRDDILAAALAAALQTVRGKYGDPNGDGWRWDRIRKTNVNHLLRLPELSSLNLTNQGGVGTLSPSLGNGTHGSSWRMVVELDSGIKAWATYPGGQSGNPVSSRYRDRIPLWVAGQLEAVHLPRTVDALAEKSRPSELTLTAPR
ncbi:MAG: penicillin amidase family protein [Gemmatimonadetes bacterium]|nr:penicillin amidase family protein [Gemmatimonadota bacterium]